MREIFVAINQMVADSVISDYAIGGAIGAAFYVEAKATDDIDIFVHITPAPPQFTELSAIYAYAAKKGYKIDREFIIIDTWDIQFLLPANGSLEDEAVKTANVISAYGVEIRVMMPEYLCAIALATKREKDFDRVRAFIKQEKVDIGELKILITKFQLEESWQRIRDML